MRPLRHLGSSGVLALTLACSIDDRHPIVRAAAAECVGRAPLDRLCLAGDVYECGPDLLTTRLVEACGEGGCSAAVARCADEGLPGVGGGTGSQDGGAMAPGSAALPPGVVAECDAEAFPAGNPCVISEELGVFVAPTGDDSAGDGSRDSPFASLARGAEVARASGRRVYACATAGAFSERLVLGEGLDGLELFGGFSCADWSHDSELRALVASPFPVALELEGSINGMRFESFVFQSSSAFGTGESSVAARIVDSRNVRFVSTSFISGDGGAGAAGRNAANGENGLSPGGPGRGPDADCIVDLVEAGPAGAVNACGSVAGDGGGTVPPPIPLAFFGGSGAPGPDNGGIPSEVLGESGGSGRPGLTGASGAAAIASPASGVFSSLGYVPPVAGAGEPGAPGQGGGGGTAGNAFDESEFCRQALGGAGGLGGCGGEAGGGGQGGGASVALLSWNSQVSLNACALQAGNGGPGGVGGTGGDGGAGEAGAPGGAGTVIRNGIVSFLSGDGAAGARGGSGGPGGGGAGASGGPSIGVVFEGDPPVQLDGTLIELGVGGVGGLGGQGGNSRGVSGAPGQALATFTQ